MTIYGIKNTTLRRIVLVATVAPLFLLMAACQVFIGLIEAVEDTGEGFRNCWKDRTDIKLATIKGDNSAAV